MSRIVFSGASLLDGIHVPVAGRTVVVEDDRIVEVVPDDAFALRPGDLSFPLGGRTVMPGMVQAHWHGSYAGLDFEPPPVGLERPPGYLMLLSAKHARMALDRGFTSLIGAAVGDALDAQLKAAIEDGVLQGPRIMPSGRWLITTGDSNDLPDFWWWGISAPGSQRYCDGADEFRKGAREEIKQGAEIIKIFLDSGHALLYGTDFVSMTDEELLAAVQATHHRGKKIRAHVTAKKAILQCIDAGVDVLDHADRMDAECIDRMSAAGSFVCPSMYLPKAMLAMVRQQGEGGENDPFFQVLRSDLEHMCEILPRAADAGVKLLVGDDWGTVMTPHGDYIKEMELYVNDAGIEPLEVLRWATVHGAECMGLGDELGTITPGKLADLLVVDGDPSRDITVLSDPGNLCAIMKNGVFVKEISEVK
jgi:imidazolonepropionase-like amidohydrolase